MPLVLPPVATGLILLRLLGPRGPLGRLLDALGLGVVFTWRAVVVAMAVMALPLLVRSARAGFEQVDRRYEQMAATLGAAPARVFLTVSLPLARRALLAGTLLAFSRALGEFGATVMLAGALPGTRTTVDRDLRLHADRPGGTRDGPARGGRRPRVRGRLRLQSPGRAGGDRMSALAFVLDLEVRQGEFTLVLDIRTAARSLAFVGPSGAGKTTVLDAIAGLRRPARGTVVIGDRQLYSSADGVDVPVHRRRVGYVPQDVALFPHLDVTRNITYGARPDGRWALGDVVDLLDIGHLDGRAVGGLSGGEQQRVAIARALVAGPDVLLLDEPLSAVDPDRRARILPYIERVRDDLQVPIVYVSHAPDEVARVADQVVRLERGRVVDDADQDD